MQRVPFATQLVLSNFDKRFERFRLGLSECGQRATIELHVGAREAVHEARVADAVLPRAGVDLLRPQFRKVSFFVLAISVRVLQRFLHARFRDAIAILAFATIPYTIHQKSQSTTFNNKTSQNKSFFNNQIHCKIQ